MTSSNTSDPNIDITSPYTPRRPTPIVSISMNNPLGSALRKIKNFLTHKQTLFATTFSIKVTPIVAMVSLFGVAAVFGGGIATAYNFGKTVEQKFLATTPSPTPKIVVVAPVVTTVSKAGTIKATYDIQKTQNASNSDSQTIRTSDASGSPSILVSPTSQPTPTPNILHYILVSKSGSINYLTSTVVNLQNYLNLRVLITGSLNSTTNTLSITKTSDIEVLQ